MRRSFRYIIITACLGVLAYILIPSVGRTCGDQNSTLLRARTDIRQTAICITSYMTSGGRIRIAPNLNAIDEDILPEIHRRYSDPESGLAYDWIYHRQSIRGSSPTNTTILLAAPFVYNRNPILGDKEEVRVVAYMDCHAEILSEEAYQEAIRKQIEAYKEKVGN